MFHLFGNILTTYGTAANNFGENEGNIRTLQKLNWKSEVYSSVSSEAIRWALRYHWQIQNYDVNRIWEEDNPDKIRWQDENFDAVKYIDDDVLGFMKVEAAKQEGSEQPQKEELDNSEDVKDSKKDTKAKQKKKKKPQGTYLKRRGVLDITRAVSTVPYSGDITFNAFSGEKKSTSLYSTEVHATRYQFGFAVTPEYLKDKSRISAVIDGLTSIGEVAGNHARFLFDFAPESIVLRWTHDASPRFLYCFEEDEFGNISIPNLIRLLEVGDIKPEELWIGGKIADSLEDLNIGDSQPHIFRGVKTVVEDIKNVIAQDLQLVARDS